MQLDYTKILELFIEIAVFLVLMVVFKFLFNKIRNNSNRTLNPTEYFPEEEVHSLRQVFFLIMMASCFINVLYSFIYITDDLLYFVIFDIILSLYIGISLDKSSRKNRILLILLIPYGSLTYILFNSSLVGLLDLIHIPVFIYFIKVYYDKFIEYTESNGLGIAIILLFIIVFISFLLTQIDEHVNPLDALVMVSNAFTSNGNAVLGSSALGKINALFLVWSGYLISSVGTATLTAAVLTRHFNKKFDKLEEMIKKNNED